MWVGNGDDESGSGDACVRNVERSEGEEYRHIPARHPAHPTRPTLRAASLLFTCHPIAAALHKCLEWLDRQPPPLVSYNSFGTTWSLRKEQVREMSTVCSTTATSQPVLYMGAERR
jgi:hypothetical protein